LARERDQINFRAWDEYHGKMRTCEEFPLYYDIDNGFHSGLYADNGEWYDLPLMQSTGLRDKTGKEIYEDDVVKTPNGDWGVIRYEAPFFGVTVSADSVSHYRRDWMESCEIIGNIHANPELLTK